MNSSLSLISGLVTDLVIYSGEEEFVLSARQRVAGVGAAAGLAVEGLAGAAVGASLAAASSGDSVEFFSCKVGGQLIEGRFSKVYFKEGEQLEFVVEEGTRSLALAARRRSDSVLWMVPHCSRGTAAHYKFCIFLFLFLSIGLPIFGLVIYLVFGVWANHLPLELSGVQFMGMIDIAFGGLTAIYYSVRFYQQWLPIARRTDAILAALGYLNPSNVNLPRDHKIYCKANGIKWPYWIDGAWVYHYLDPRR